MARYELNDNIEVAIPGVWNGFPVTDKVIDSIIKNNTGSKAPTTRGHVSELPPDAICEGFITNPRLKDNKLVFQRTLYDQMARDWEDNKFINVSMDLNCYNNGQFMIPSIAMLGAKPPAIKGLKTFEELYSDSNVVITKVFENEEYKTLRFTQKISEVIMPEKAELQFSEIYKQGEEAATAKLTLEFAEKQKTALEEQEKTLTAKFAEEKKGLEKEISELKAEKEETEKKRFSEKIEEVKARFPETKHEEVEKKMKEFADSGMSYDVFEKVADMAQPEVEKFSEREFNFSEKDKKKSVNTANNI